jgi:hypothetical protein
MAQWDQESGDRLRRCYQQIALRLRLADKSITLARFFGRKRERPIGIANGSFEELHAAGTASAESTVMRECDVRALRRREHRFVFGRFEAFPGLDNLNPEWHRPLLGVTS